MRHSKLTVALLTDLFFDDPNGERLTDRLAEARSGGAKLALLPELPLDPWVPLSRVPDDGDAESPSGRRHRLLASAGRRAGIAVLGGAIIRDPIDQRRHNTALLFDESGSLAASYRKIHLPYEEDFWEAAHYEPGAEPPEVITCLPLSLGIQICSDAYRTTGCQLLAARGAEIIIVPRATPAESWDRWRLVLRANAVTSAAWVVTVNRPSTEASSPAGGPSAVIAPDGVVVAETTDPVTIVELDGGEVWKARRDYPGYLDFYPDTYRDGWSAVAARVAEGQQDNDDELTSE